MLQKLEWNSFKLLGCIMALGCVGAVFEPGLAFAITDWGQAATNTNTAAQKIGSVVPTIFFALGIITAGSGLLMLVKAVRDPHGGGKGMGIGIFLVGALLCALPYVIGMTAMTVTGADSAAAGLGKLGISY